MISMFPENYEVYSPKFWGSTNAMNGGAYMVFFNHPPSIVLFFSIIDEMVCRCYSTAQKSRNWIWASKSLICQHHLSMERMLMRLSSISLFHPLCCLLQFGRWVFSESWDSIRLLFHSALHLVAFQKNLQVLMEEITCSPELNCGVLCTLSHNLQVLH